MTREDIERLRKQIDELRSGSQHAAAPATKAPAPPAHLAHNKEVVASSTLIESMDRLHTVLDKLVRIFENANKEIYDEYAKGQQDTDAKLGQIIAQNEKLARGIVAIADIAKQVRQESAAPPPPGRDFGGQAQRVPVQPTQFSATVPSPSAVSPQPLFAAPIPAPNTTPRSAASSPMDLNEESFMRQQARPVGSSPPQDVLLPTTPRTASVPPPPPAPPSMPPLPALAPEQRATPPIPVPSWSSVQASAAAEATPAATAPGNLSERFGADIPPPPPPPGPPSSRRSLLDKFSFR